MPRALSLVPANDLLGHRHANGVLEIFFFLSKHPFHVFKMFPSSSCIDKGKKSKGPYWTSVTRNSTHQTEEPEVSGVPPLFSTSALFNGHLKLLKVTQKEKKPKQGFEVTP